MNASNVTLLSNLYHHDAGGLQAITAHASFDECRFVSNHAEHDAAVKLGLSSNSDQITQTISSRKSANHTGGAGLFDQTSTLWMLASSS